MDEKRLWVYVGQGAFLDGVPARDLTEADFARLDEGARAAVENSGLYRPAKRKAEEKPAPKTAAPQSEEDAPRHGPRSDEKPKGEDKE